tara:strand:+ start:4512 stop:5102 length:591 start_codon:yes stop_codon:yes gene_type:complete
MIRVDLADIKKSKSNLIYCKTSIGTKFYIPDKCARPWEEKNYSILNKILKIYCFWIYETEIYLRDGDHERASILTTHGNLFKKIKDILDIFKNNELKPIYEKGFVNVMVCRDINQTNTSALYITRGDSNNEISDVSLTTIKGLADKLNYRVYKYVDPSGSGIVKSLNDNGGYTKNGSFITYKDSSDLNQVAIYDPT